MRNISLLPTEIRLYRRSAQKWNSFIMAMCIVVAVVIIIYMAMTIFMLLPSTELNSVKQERAEVQSGIEKLKPYEDMLNEANVIKAQVKEAMGSNPEWSNFYSVLYNGMPDNVWLTDFSSTYKGQTGDYSIKGWAKSHDDVAEWLKGLQKSNEINNVLCQYTVKNNADDGNTVQFEIKAKILPGKAYEPLTEGGQN